MKRRPADDRPPSDRHTPGVNAAGQHWTGQHWTGPAGHKQTSGRSAKSIETLAGLKWRRVAGTPCTATDHARPRRSEHRRSTVKVLTDPAGMHYRCNTTNVSANTKPSPPRVGQPDAPDQRSRAPNVNPVRRFSGLIENL
jgi:hypothetical protein